jgi:hypothetical protein
VTAGPGSASLGHRRRITEEIQPAGKGGGK